jgi:hypothetical protein
MTEKLPVKKKPYTKPHLYCYGTLAEMTRMKAGNVGQLDGGKLVNMRKTGGP